MNYQNLQMIHGDIHFDNIIIGKSNTFFCDFDDVCIGDYRMDLALLLFDLAIISTPIGDWSTINKYANRILKGYNENSNHPNVEFDDLEPLFKLLEINFYIEFRTLESTDLEDGWIKRFLINRRDSVESKKVFWRRPT
jgi:Ser/Thr protein kinase RdoA (MazF antagonist)